MSQESPSQPEPWLRGPLEGVDARLAPILRALEQAHEDLARCAEGLTAAQIWSNPHGLTSLGFHLRHIAGSIDRLSTYLLGGQLSAEQMAYLRSEAGPGASALELLAAVDAAIARASRIIRELHPDRFTEAREVGRKRLPTTAIGLAIHIAEHTQRHVGQAITTSKLLNAV